MLIGITDLRRRRVVGFVHTGPGEDAETGELYAIHVHPTMQRRGYGQCLLNAAMRELACVGYQRAQLWVLQGNEPTQGFYRRHGWDLVDGARRDDEIEGAVVAEVAFARGLPSPRQRVLK
jgi:ribosomal protein S18 acetylase RimI-like enzyme